MHVLRFSLPNARSGVHPRIAAILRWLPGVLLIAWVLTLPLEFTKLFFPNQAIEVSRIVLVLCILTFACQVIVERREVRIPASASVLGLALITVYSTASAAAVGSVQGTKTAFAMIAYLLMMLTVFNWTQSFADHRRIWSALAVTAVGLSVVGLIFHATSFYIWNEPNAGVLRVNATFRDPNIFARFLAFSMLTMVVLAADLDVTLRQRALWVGAALVSAVVIAFTYSRAGWGFTLVTAVAVIALARRRRRALALVGLLVAAFAVVALIDPSVLSRAALLAENLQAPFNNRAFIDRAPWLQFLNYLPVDSVRQYLIGAGLIMFADHPIFGIGFGAFSQALAGGAYAGLVPPGVATTASHTSLVTIVAETGVVGLALVLLTGFFFVRSMVRGGFQSPLERTLVLAPVVGLMLVVLDSQFSGRFFDESYLWLFLGLAYSARAGLRDASITLPRAARAEVA
jgi:O-antigen ligase